MTRDEIIETAGVYLYQGLVRQDVEAVRSALAPGCWRTEQGKNTGESGDAIAEMFKQPIFDIITGVRAPRWFVEGEQAIVFYELELQDGKLPNVLIAERFRVADGRIHEIEAIFHAQQAESS